MISIKKCAILITVVIMKYFDTHTHYDWAEFDEDRKLLLKKLENTIIVNIGVNGSSNIETIKYTNEYKNVYACLGLHPMNVSTMEDLNNIKEIMNDKVVAIGETGIDYKFPNIELQKEYFIKHINLANDLNLPIVIHCRKAHEEVYNILINNPVNKKGIMHCYSGNLEYAKKFLKLGFYFGFDGPVTRDNKYDEIIKFLPLDKIIVETDAPLMPPFPLDENSRCDSSSLKYIIEKIAKVKKMDIDVVTNQIFLNSKRVYNIK